MTGLLGCWIRRMAGVAGVLAAVALIAAPAALASGRYDDHGERRGFSSTAWSTTALRAPLPPRSRSTGATAPPTSSGSYNGPTRSSAPTPTPQPAPTRARSRSTAAALRTAGRVHGHVRRDTSVHGVPAGWRRRRMPVPDRRHAERHNDPPGRATKARTKAPRTRSSASRTTPPPRSSSIPISTPPNSGTLQLRRRRHCATTARDLSPPAACRSAPRARRATRTNGTPCAFPSPAGQPAPDPANYTGSTAERLRRAAELLHERLGRPQLGHGRVLPGDPAGRIDLLQPGGAAKRLGDQRRLGTRRPVVQRRPDRDRHGRELQRHRQPERLGHDRVLPVRA